MSLQLLNKYNAISFPAPIGVEEKGKTITKEMSLEVSSLASRA